MWCCRRRGCEAKRKKKKLSDREVGGFAEGTMKKKKPLWVQKSARSTRRGYAAKPNNVGRLINRKWRGYPMRKQTSCGVLRLFDNKRTRTNSFSSSSWILEYKRQSLRRCSTTSVGEYDTQQMRRKEAPLLSDGERMTAQKLPEILCLDPANHISQGR